MAGIGDIRVDLVANTASFGKGLDVSLTAIERWQYKVSGAITRAGDNVTALVKRADRVVGFGKAFDQAGGMIGRFTDRLTSMKAVATVAIGALGVGALVAQLDNAADIVDKTGKIAARLEVPIEQMSVLRYAAGQANIELEQLGKLAGKGAKNLAEMVGNGDTMLKLGGLSVRLTDANGNLRSIVDLLPEIAKGISSASSAGEKLSLATKIFGREGGPDFVQLMNETGKALEGLGEAGEKAARRGVIFNQEQFEKLRAYRDQVDDFKQALLGVKVAIASELAPTATLFLNNIANRISDLPAIVRASGLALKDLAGGDMGQQAEARNRLGGVIEAAGSLLLGTAKETGHVLGVAIVESLQVGIVAARPVISEALRDAVHSALKGTMLETWGPQASTRLRMEEAAKALDNYERLLGKVAQTPVINGGDFFGGSGGGSPMFAGPAAGSDQAKRLLDLQQNVRRLEVELNSEKSQQTRLFGATLANGMDATSVAFERATTNIRRLVVGLDTATGAVTDYYKAASGANVASSMPTAARSSSFNYNFDPSLLADSHAATEQFTRVLQIAGELETRRLEAIGDKLGAERARIQAKFEQEVQNLVKELEGNVPPELLQSLREVQELEVKAVDKAKAKSLWSQFDKAGQLRETRAEIVRLRNEGELTSTQFDTMTVSIDKQIREIEAKANDLGATLSKSVEGFGDDAGRAFAKMAISGKGSFADLAASWAETMIAMVTTSQIFGPLAKFAGGAIASFFQGSGGTPNLRMYEDQRMAGLSATGAEGFANVGVQRFAKGGAVLGATAFPLATGLIGEAGNPELYLPARRMPNGELGVQGGGGGPPMVQIIDQRGSGAPPQVSSGKGPDGRQVLRIIIRDEMNAALADGSMDRVGGVVYGWTRQSRR